jgi:methylmalonyl-CoA epimerase
MKVIAIDHISIAVRELDQAIENFARLLNLEAKDRRRVRSIGAENAFIPIGDSAVELMQPLDDPDAPDDVRKRLERRGEGMMNLCLTVEDLEDAKQHLRNCGARIIEGKDADGDEIVFVHPKDVHGVLIELRTGKRKIKGT